MRLWSLSPKYLDQKGLVACWREALLAQSVLVGRTRGYTRHPQLNRFRAQPDPVLAISSYLRGLWIEADRRGYHFDQGRVLSRAGTQGLIPVTAGQVEFEYRHLMQKLQARAPAWASRLSAACPEPVAWSQVELHPLFVAVEGSIEAWERG